MAKTPKPPKEKPVKATKAAPRPADPPAAPPPSKPAAPKPPRERSSWLARFAPGVRLGGKAEPRRETPDNLWVKDPDTGEMIYRPDLEAAWWVTPSGRHMRIGPKLRFAFTFDDGAFEAVPTPPVVDDPLKFVDDRPYPDRLKTARKTTGEPDAMAIGYGRIKDTPAVVLVQDFAFMGGSLGMAAGEGFIAAAEAAVKRKAPLVAFTAAGGARMQEGALSLMQMARTTLAIQELKAARLPYIVVLTDPTTGGVTASYAMLGDIHLAEPGAMIGFAGPRVIEETIRETLPPGFQRSEYLVDKGMVDKVVGRKDLPDTLGSILKTLMLGRARAA
ncbi:MAG: acetyl-CoA carboxylase carboxyltransferase subunit beta [Caulobacteraceae bacterium]